ncbi:MAG: hypothetical protein R3B68_06030 [Phycisphaerales bacterium]
MAKDPQSPASNHDPRWGIIETITYGPNFGRATTFVCFLLGVAMFAIPMPFRVDHLHPAIGWIVAGVIVSGVALGVLATIWTISRLGIRMQHQSLIRRSRHSNCVCCRYPLADTQPRCPECGTLQQPIVDQATWWLGRL